MTNITTNSLQGADQSAKTRNFANEATEDARQQANQPKDSAGHQSLAAAVTELRAIFTELDKSYDKNTPIGRSMIMAKAVEAIETKPTLKKKIAIAIKQGTAVTLEAAVAHPSVKSVIATIKGFIEA